MGNGGQAHRFGNAAASRIPTGTHDTENTTNRAEHQDQEQARPQQMTNSGPALQYIPQQINLPNNEFSSDARDKYTEQNMRGNDAIRKRFPITQVSNQPSHAFMSTYIFRFKETTVSPNLRRLEPSNLPIITASPHWAYICLYCTSSNAETPTC